MLLEESHGIDRHGAAIEENECTCREVIVIINKI
jgi:hypothetical protein